MSLFFQTLESRTLLTATLHTEPNDNGGGGNALLIADRQQYMADIQQYKNDATTMTSTLAADQAKVAADKKAICDAKKGAKAQLEADRKSMLDALRADGLAGKPVYDKWHPVIEADRAAIKADGENSENLAADKAKLEADFQAARDEMAPFEAQTHADIEKWNAIIRADKAALENTGNQPLIDQLKADQAQLKADELSFKKLLCADQKKIIADIVQMKKDGGGDKGGDKGNTTQK